MRRVKAVGPRPCPIAFVGEAPGAEDLKYGEVFSGGRAAHLFIDMLTREGIDHSEVFLTNISDYYIENKTDLTVRTPENLQRLSAELDEVDPNVIVTLGAIATRSMGIAGDLDTIHGKCFRHAENPKRTIFPMYNPGAGIRDANKLALMFRDMAELRRIMHGERGHYPRDEVKTQYSFFGEGPAPTEAPNLAIDTEGYDYDPWCATYSWGPGAASLVWAEDPDGLAHLQTLVYKADKVIFHNAQWDVKVLRAMGITVPPDKWEDTMLLAYALQLAPQGLKALAARYLGMEMKSFADTIFPTDQTIALQYLEEVRTGSPLWTKFDHPEPILEQDTEGKYVVKAPQKLRTRLKTIFTALEKDPDCDVRKRWMAIPAEVRRPAEDSCGLMPEFTFSMLPKTVALNYACADADATLRLFPLLWQEAEFTSVTGAYRSDMSVLPMVESMEHNGIHASVTGFEKLSEYFEAQMEEVRKKIIAYNGGKWINPNSPKQLGALLFDRLRLPALRRSKKTRIASTNDKVLEEIKHLHKVVPLVQQFRESLNNKKFSDLMPQYVNPKTGCVHTRIKTTRVVSGRYASQDPNLLAIPARTSDGLRIRNCFSARQAGWVMGSADLDQIELRVLAGLAQENTMIDAIEQGVDLHSKTASILFDLPMEQVSTGEGKRLYRTPAKTINFGIVYGISAKGLQDQLRAAGLNYTVDDCQNFLDRYLTWVYPGIAEFIAATRDEARLNGFVRTLQTGRIRYLPQVWNEFDENLREEALRQAVSHKVQGTAQDWIKESMKHIWDELWDQPFVRFLLQIHDELVVEADERYLDIVEQVVVESLSGSFITPGSGRSVPISAGMNWAPTWGGLKA